MKFKDIVIAIFLLGLLAYAACCRNEIFGLKPHIQTTVAPVQMVNPSNTKNQPSTTEVIASADSLNADHSAVIESQIDEKSGTLQ